MQISRWHALCHHNQGWDTYTIKKIYKYLYRNTATNINDNNNIEWKNMLERDEWNLLQHNNSGTGSFCAGECKQLLLLM